MISRISGTVAEVRQSAILVENAGMCYEVFLPPAVMRNIGPGIKETGRVSLVTYHYYQMEPSRGVPVLIGFTTDVEKEFFEQFISVSGIGPRAACRALTESFSDTAAAIDEGDMAFLKRLPGIGEQKARLIVAKLQGKVGKYGLIQDRSSGGTETAGKYDIKREASAILAQLQYKKNEADDMIDKALKRDSSISTSEGLLNEIYRQKKQDS